MITLQHFFKNAFYLKLCPNVYPFISSIKCVERIIPTVSSRVLSVLAHIVNGDNVFQFKPEIEKAHRFSNQEWEEFEAKVKTKYTRVSIKAIDVFVMSLFLNAKNPEAGKAYFNFLKQSRRDLHVGTLSKVLRILFIDIQNGKSAESVRSLISEVLAQINEKTSILDGSSAEHYILIASCYKDLWKDGLKTLEDYKLMGVPNIFVYSYLMKASFDFEEPDIGFQLGKEVILDYGKRPLSLAYIGYINYCERSVAPQESMLEKLEKLFNFVADYDILLEHTVWNRLQELLSQHTEQFVIGNAGVIRGRSCSFCKHEMEKVHLSESEFSHLANVFFQNAVVGKNVFLKSTPTELKGFLDFFEKEKPFDVVIDGLNVAYSVKRQTHQDNQALLLHRTVEYFAEKGMKVLVLGRKHMQKWPKRVMSSISRMSHVFLANDLSQDDPFILYATLKSGSHSCFLSRDYMRGHSFLIKDEQTRVLFRRWQITHQYWLDSVTKTGNVKIRAPWSYLPTAQKSSLTKDQCTWHIPIQSEMVSDNPVLRPPLDWKCIQCKR